MHEVYTTTYAIARFVAFCSWLTALVGGAALAFGLYGFTQRGLGKRQADFIGSLKGLAVAGFGLLLSVMRAVHPRCDARYDQHARAGKAPVEDGAEEDEQFRRRQEDRRRRPSHLAVDSVRGCTDATADALRSAAGVLAAGWERLVLRRDHSVTLNETVVAT